MKGAVAEVPHPSKEDFAMTTATGNYIVEVLFLLTFVGALLWPDRPRH